MSSQLSTQRAGAPTRPRYHPEERATGMQADAVHGWSVQGLGGATYRKVGSALHGFQSAIAAFLPCHTTLYGGVRNVSFFFYRKWPVGPY